MEIRDSTTPKVVILGMILCVLLLGMLGITAIWLHHNLQVDHDWVRHTEEVKLHIASFLSVMQDAETGQRGYLLTGNLNYLEPYNDAQGHAQDSLAQLRESTADNLHQQSILDKLDSLVVSKLSELEKTIVTRQDEDFEAALKVVLTDQGKNTMDNIRELTKQMNAEEYRLLRLREGSVSENTLFAARLMVLDLVLLLATTSFVYIAFRRTLRSRLQAEMLLRQSEERFQLATHGTNEGIWDRDIRTGQEWWSDQFHSLLGYERGEIESNYASFQRLLHPEDKVTVLDAIKAHLEMQGLYDVEFRLGKKSGDYWWFRARGQAVWDETGRPVRMAGSIQDISDHKKASDALKASEKLYRQLLILQENERRMVAHDIHDGFVQDVVGAHMCLQAVSHSIADQDGAKSAMDGIESLLRKAIAEGRRLIRDLRPMVLDESGIVEALTHLAAEETKNKGLSIDLQCEVQFDRLAAMLEGAIFRIVQEALNNIRQHSQTNQATVQLIQNGGMLHIVTRDQGVGFDPERVSPDRFGLRGIRERAHLFGGIATVNSAPGEGTSIEVSIELSPEPAQQTE